MDNEDEELKRLMAEACAAPEGSCNRNRCLTRVVEIVQLSNRLYRSSSPCYPEAIQETWFRVFRSPENYNPDKRPVITWINVTLRYRLRDAIRNNSGPPRIRDTAESSYNLLENLPARPEVPPMLEVTMNWINTDPQQLLRKTHLPHRPDVTAQLLLFERFPPPTKWDVLAQRLGIPRTTLHKFYSEKCLPLLRDFGSDQGYL